MADKYEVLNPTGLDYPDPAGSEGAEKHAKQGDIVDDLPAVSITWLREQGHIKPAKGYVTPVKEEK